MNSVGQAVKGEVEAASQEEAVAKIRGLGYFPTKVKEKAGQEGRPAKARRGRRPSGPAAGAASGGSHASC